MARGATKPAVTPPEPVAGPWELPAGWHWERLGDLGSWCGGGTPSKLKPEYWVGGTIPWVSPKDMKRPRIDSTEDRITEAAIAGSSAKLIAAGAVMCVMRSGILRHTFPVAVNDVEVAINQDMRALRVRAGVLADFVAHYLRARSQHILDIAMKGGTTVNSVEAARLDELMVPLPPLECQQRIVNRIDELFTEVDDAEEALARAKQDLTTWRKALLKAAVTGELTADWRAANPTVETGPDLLARLLVERRDRWSAAAKNKGKRYVNPAGPNITASSDLPSTWAWTTVGIAGDVLLGRQRSPAHHSGEHMRPYLRVANVMEGWLRLGDVKEMNFTPAEFETFSLKYGDVLLNEGQAPDLLGRPAIYRDEIPGCCFQKTLLRFRPTPVVTPEFALIVFRHYMHGKRFLRESRITTNIGHLTQVRFLPMEFPLPPIAEQREIASRIDVAESAWDTELRDTDASPTLRQSILAAAFRGDLVQ